eukprot:TRINITY_DN23663_c0_g1_i1.p1 TRINITY_DN23663_c0_g1~~TRINITY_DN23663_c0_g1_i1.p1  ORF type:complete len:164 (-),score=49.75 TRINITY_DN23663_c0_g1_i1:139-630(-)
MCIRDRVSTQSTWDEDIIKELKLSHEKDIPLNIKGSAYSKINKEMMKKLREESNQLRKEDKLDKRVQTTREKYLPKSYMKQKALEEKSKPKRKDDAAKKGQVARLDRRDLVRAIRQKRRLEKAGVAEISRIGELNKRIRDLRKRSSGGRGRPSVNYGSRRKRK